MPLSLFILFLQSTETGYILLNALEYLILIFNAFVTIFLNNFYSLEKWVVFLKNVLDFWVALRQLPCFPNF